MPIAALGLAIVWLFTQCTRRTTPAIPAPAKQIDFYQEAPKKTGLEVERQFNNKFWQQ